MIIARLAFAYAGVLLLAMSAAIVEAFVAYPLLIPPEDTMGGLVCFWLLASALPALGVLFVCLAMKRD